MAKAENLKDQAIGKIKETAGKVLGKKKLETKGKMQKTKGKVKDKVAKETEET